MLCTFPTKVMKNKNGLWIFYVFVLSCVCYVCARLFICAFWSPAGKGLTSWLSFVVSSVSLSLSHWYPGSGVVLDCIDSWSLHLYLLCCHGLVFDLWSLLANCLFVFLFSYIVMHRMQGHTPARFPPSKITETVFNVASLNDQRKGDGLDTLVQYLNVHLRKN